MRRMSHKCGWSLWHVAACALGNAGRMCDGRNFRVTGNTYCFDFLLARHIGAMRIVTGTAPELSVRNSCALALGELFNFAGGDYVAVVRTNKNICAEAVFRLAAGMKVSPVLTGVQDAAGSLEMALLADAVSGSSAQSRWVNN